MSTKEEISEKLEYLGLNLESPSESLIKFEPINFNLSRLKEDKDLKVYRYILIKDIQILLTPHNKGEDLKIRYGDAVPIGKYLVQNSEDTEDYARYLEFLNLFRYFSKEEIEKIEKEQLEYINNMPFEIRYDRSHMWSIYYDEKLNKYFMLVCTKEADFTELFYIIKKKIELDNTETEVTKEKIKIEEDIVNRDKLENTENLNEYFSEEEKDINIQNNINEEINIDDANGIEEVADNNILTNKYIYAPINYISLSDKYISSNELLEIENYLWYFTKNWPITFDFYDMKNNYSLIIKGETKIFDRLDSDYKYTIKSKEDAIRIYKHLKALFTLDSSTDKYFNFKPEIKKNFELQFKCNNIEIGYDDIPDFLFKKYNELYQEIVVLNEQNKSKTVKFNMLKDDLSKKEQTYKEKQLEVVQYLDCKKSFTKKVRYFFKKSKRITRTEVNKSQIKEEIRKKLEEDRKEVQVDYTIIETLENLEKKEFYTIDDFIFVYSLYEKLKRKVSELTLDIRAIKLSLLNINNKLSNVEIYLDEIDSHKKSIFEFWKFTNKDNKLSLEEAELDEDGKEIIHEEKQLERVFNFDMDIEAIGEKVDEIQRKKLSKEEINSIFLLNQGFLPYVNMLKIKDLDEYAIISFLDDLKKEYKEDNKYLGEEFDVFGSVETSVKTRYLKTKEFREVNRNRLKICSINQSLDKFRFLEKLTEILKYTDESMAKIKTPISLPIYKLIPSIEKISHNTLEIFNIDIKKELEDYIGVGNNANLIKINLPEGSPSIFYTNIMYYENQNSTLPLGIDVETKILLDLSQFKLKEVKREKIIINKYFKNYLEQKSFKNINIIEYDIIE